METITNELKLTYKSFLDVIIKKAPGIKGFSNAVDLTDLLEGFVGRFLQVQDGTDKLTYRAAGGGTYNLLPGQNISILNNPDISFLGNSFTGLPDDFTVCIMGGGPNGLFMAIIMHYILKDYGIAIHVVETRVDEEGRRKLTRSQQLRNNTRINLSYDIGNVFLQLLNIFAPELVSRVVQDEIRYYPAIGRIEVTILDLMKLIPEYKAFIKATGYTVGEDFTAGTKPTYETTILQTRVLEFSLAREAQKLGIKIYHETDPAIQKNADGLIAKYTNDKTMILFDATGGRLFKIMDGFQVVNTITPNSNLYNEKYTTEMRHRGTFNVYEGFLSPDDAIRPLTASLLYIAVGDTTLRSDFRYGKGLAFNWLLELFYMLTIGKVMSGSDTPSIPIQFKDSFKNIFRGGGKNNMLMVSRMSKLYENTAHYSIESQKVFNICKAHPGHNKLQKTCKNGMMSNAAKLRELEGMIKSRPMKTWPYTGYNKGGRRTRRSTRRQRGRP